MKAPEKEKQDHRIDEWLEEPIRRTLSEVDEEVKKIVEEDTAGTSESDAVHEGVIPEIKGLNALKEEAFFSVDLEKTISDMFTTTKNMEAQLERVLNINIDLEKDLKASREMISILKSEKARLEKTIAKMEDEIPSKRELQIEIEHLIEERNSAQGAIHGLKLKLGDMRKAQEQLQNRVAGLGEEKRDTVAEINFLESRLNAAVEKIKIYESKINTLKGQNLAQTQKIRSLEDELSEALADKYKLLKDIKESRDALEEVRSTVAESKLQAKKSFYGVVGGEE